MENQFFAWIASYVVGIGVVAVFIEKNLGKVRKAIKIADETLDVLNSILDASEDKRITAKELEVIMAQVTELQAALK
jgi:hypothetical protein